MSRKVTEQRAIRRLPSTIIDTWGKGFATAIRLSGVILPAPPVIPAAFGYLYGREVGGE
jgi:hypothetical protein